MSRSRIAVAIASRGRPLALIGVVMSLWRLRTGDHDIAFAIGIDDDDEGSLSAVKMLSHETPTVPFIGPRAGTLGAVQNRILSESRDSDVVTLTTDRTFPLTYGWDDAIAYAVSQHDKHVLWWSSPVDQDLVIPIISKRLGDAMEWRYSPEIFPFWFDDTWWSEINMMVHHHPSIRVMAAYAGVRELTTRGRDFAFWLEVYRSTHGSRVARAKEIAKAMGIEWRNPTSEMLGIFQARNNYQSGKAEEFERIFGDKRPPDAGYLETKRRAEEALRVSA